MSDPSQDPAATALTEHHVVRLGHQGDGIAAGPVFAPLTLPGEVVRGHLDGQTLRDIRIVTPSPARVTAPCRHFRSCGGCQVQHASGGFVAGWKQDIVTEALRAYDIEPEFGPMHVSPPNSRRRATLSARRTRKDATAGFHACGSDMIVEIPDCRLLHPDLLRGPDIARDLARIGTSRKSEIAVSLTRSGAGLDVTARGGKPLDRPLREALSDIAARHDLARLTWGDETVVMRCPPFEIFGAARVVPPPGAFLQATAQGQAALQSAAAAILAGARRVVDLFAGCGTFTLPLAATAQVHAVEGDAAMLDALSTGWRGSEGLCRVTTEPRDLFRRPLLPDELARHDAAVIDPPRAGAEAQIAQIAHARLPRLAHISCNPVTFARDAQHLIARGYVLGPIHLVDQFRWSSHVELVAGFYLKSP